MEAQLARQAATRSRASNARWAFALVLAAAMGFPEPSRAQVPPAGTLIVNTASSTQQVGAATQTISSNAVALAVGSAPAPAPTLTKSFGALAINTGTSTPLSFVITNAVGNPAQSGIGFVDTLPTGLRLTPTATAVVSGAGCTGTAVLTQPRTITFSAGALSAGTASCTVTVNGVTNAAGGNPDCAMNPAAFTNGAGAISGLTNVVNGVTNQCLVVATQNGQLLTSQTTALMPGSTYSFPHTLLNGPFPDTYTLSTTNLPGTFNFTNIQIFADANGDGVADSATPLAGPINLVANQSFRFVVVVSVPPTAVGGNLDELQVTATSTLPARLPIPPVTDRAEIVVGPPPPPTLDTVLIKSIGRNSGPSPSGPYTVRVRYLNVSHADGGKNDVTVVDNLPTGMTAVTGSLRIKPFGNDPGIVLSGTSGNFTAHDNRASYTLSSSSVSVAFSRLEQGQWGLMEFDVNIVPGLDRDTVIRNTASVSWTDPDGVTVRPRVSNTAEFLVTASEGVTLVGATIPTAAPGATVSFENVLTNTSSRTDTFDITLSASNYPAGTVFRLYRADGVTLLTDSNSNGIVDTGPVAAGAQFRIVVKTELPNGAAGGPFTVNKNARSISNPLVTATGQDVLTAIPRTCRVVLEPNNTGRVAPGGSITYSHTLTNVGNCVENITFPANMFTTQSGLPAASNRSVGTVALAQADGWTAQIFMDGGVSGGQAVAGTLDASDTDLSAAATFTLQPGGKILFLDRVTVPANAANGAVNTTTFRVNAGSAGLVSNTDVTTVVTGSAPIVTDQITGFIDPGFQRPTVWAFIGRPLYLQANAPSCNANPTVIERRTIIITGPNGEREELIATETGPNTGMFSAEPINVRLPPVIANDGMIEGRAYDVFDVELIGCGKKISTTVTLIDPNGVVFDSRNNQPVAGATVRLVTAVGGQCTGTPAAVSQLSGTAIVPAPSTFTTGSDGRFSFPLVPPGDYCAIVTAPNGYTWVSAVPASQLPAGRNIIATGPTSGGSYGGPFRVGPETGPVLIDIPVDGGLIGGLFVQKSTPRSVVEMGDSLDYAVKVSNATGYDLNQQDVMLVDTLPPGFTFVPGSARRDGKPITDPLGGAGPRLTFNLGRMIKEQQLLITYRVRIGPGAMQGDGTNRAVASYRVPGGSTLFSESNVATAKVTVTGGVFSDRAFIIGKVIATCVPDEKVDASTVHAPLGVPGVRIFLEDGTSAITDAEGKYSFYGLIPRTHVLKIDRTTLPDDVTPLHLSASGNRNAGKGDSRFVDLRQGELHKANFEIEKCTDVSIVAIKARRQAASRASTELDGRLQQRLEADPNLRVASDVKALPASGVVGATAPTASIATPSALGTATPAPSAPDTAVPKGDSNSNAARFDSLSTALASLDSNVTSTKRPLGAVSQSAPREPEVALETLLPTESSTLGFIGLTPNAILPYAQTSIRVKGSAGASFKLSVNGKDIEDARVGKRATFAEKQLQAWEYIGVDLIAGENDITVRQFDQFGNARGTHSVKVIAPGVLARVSVRLVTGNQKSPVADGKTPARLVVELADARGTPITSKTAVTLSASAGRLDVEDLAPSEPGVQVFVEGGKGEFALIPPTDPAESIVKAVSGDFRAETTVDFLPDLRDLVAAGVIEGVLNLRKLDAKGVTAVRAQDGFEQEISHISRNWNDGKGTAAARAAMYLKGKVKGEYLLTLAYDSDKNTKERLFRDIQPDEFYPIYGDSSVRAFDAQSTGRFYVRIDSQKSYLLYGDFNSSQASDVRKLANYSRSMTGARYHYESGRIAANVFASRDTARQVIDELPANGTSGPFVLSRRGGLINSEKLEVLTRDRSQPSIIIRAVPLVRFVDYELEPLTGRILLKAPVPSLDENLNPLFVRITYEVDQGGGEFWVVGADAQAKVTDQIEVGASLVDDRNPLDKFRMAGINAVAKLADKTFLVAEIAKTEREVFVNGVSGGQKSGDAKRVEFRHSGTSFDANLYAGRASEDFDNPGSSLSRGRAELGGKFAYKLDDKTRLKAEVLRTEELGAGGRRDGILLAAERTLADGWRLEGGIRHARESQPTSSAVGVVVPPEVTALRARLTGELPYIKDAAAYAELEVDVHDSARKIAALGADVKLPNGGRLYARHEFISSLTGPYGLNNQQRQNSTVVGLSTDYMKDGNVFSEYRVRDAISGGDAEAALGLRNTWSLTDGLKLNTGFERVHAMSGPGNSESTAVTTGLEYTANPLWKGSTRLEFRNGKSSDSVLATVAAAAKLSRDWTFLARETYSLVKNSGAQAGEVEQNRLQAGLAYRETDSDTWNALGRVELRSEHDSTQPNLELKRSVELISLHANWQPRRPFVFSGRFAAKWANEQSNGTSSRSRAQLLSGRAIWEFAPRWDVSANVSTMFGHNTQSKQYGVGLELGFMVMDNLWLSAGYNFFGYREEDLASGEYTSKGAYLRLRYKFDEDLFGARKPAASGSDAINRGSTKANESRVGGGD